ncbi:VTT domain-containing protein [Crateriforma spongiae]|uniref:VTT domain-containing protein n=1 Tax=Crateriforma spongiae TaxID=2724528 RepID=UPI0039AF1A5D
MQTETSQHVFHAKSPAADRAPDSNAMKGRSRWLKWIRLASMLVILVSLMLLIRALPLDQLSVVLKSSIGDLGMWGPVVLAAIYIIATVLFVPGTILTLAAGAIFGLAIGTATVSVGSTVGASLAFLIARYGARKKVASMAQHNRHFGAIDQAIEEGGWKIVALLRLSPAIPFNLQNYLYGLTPVGFWPYVVASWIAMLPGTFLYVYIGHVTGAAIAGDRERSPVEWAMLIVGLLATVAVTVYVTRLARRKLNEQVDGENEIASESEEPNGEDAPAVKTSAERQPIKTLVMAASAVLLFTFSLFANQNSDRIQDSIVSMFGPPQVEMNERYGEKPAGPKVDHSALDQLLKSHVDAEGWVDYGSLAGSEDQLQGYLDQIAEVSFDELGRDEKLTLLINGYNAATLKLIVENLPIDSIMDIPESQRWDAKRWEIGGKRMSLNQLEHEEIRPNFAEPRIHFALVCAAVGCPPLRNEAYAAEKLNSQLEEQAQYVHDHSTWFQFDPGRSELSLTKLYSWYGDDFVQKSGSVEQFAANYSSELARFLNSGETPVTTWLPYDWSLNSKSNKQAR